jgi:hypothetical protein
MGDQEVHLDEGAGWTGTDFVENFGIGPDCGAEAEFGSVGGGVEEGGLVWDPGVAPGALVTAREAEGFEVEDFEGAPRQVWVADDINHRLKASKLLGILEKGLEFIDENNIVNFEIQENTISLYELFGVTVGNNGTICLEVAKKQTNCLAPDKCGINLNKIESCSGKGCC